jgi:hypothetical protein
MVSNTYLTLPTVARYLRIDHRTLRSLARREIVSCDWLTATFTLGGKKGSKPIFLVASLERVRHQVEHYKSRALIS